MFVHTLNTWLLAQLFHPFTFFFFFFIKYPDEINIGNGTFFLVFFTVVFFISLPSLVLAILSFYPISHSGLSSYEKLILWIIAVVASIGVNYVCILLFFDPGFSQEDFYFMLPSVAAAILSILIRFRQFFEFQSNFKS